MKRVSKCGSRMEKTVKYVNGRMLKGNNARKRWAEYSEELLNVEEDREAASVAVGCIQVPVIGDENEREIAREEVKRTLNEISSRKAVDVVILGVKVCGVWLEKYMVGYLSIALGKKQKM